MGETNRYVNYSALKDDLASSSKLEAKASHRSFLF